jgi:tetratricopeptide (TPR) repeat protein
MKKTIAALCTLSCSVAILISCASQQKDNVFSFDRAPLLGMIYDEDSQPCPSVSLTVDGVKGPVTDIRGRFVMPDVSRGEHQVIARKDGYEDLSTQFLFLNKSEVLYLHMVSLGQLLTKAELSLDDRNWADAASFLERAEKLKPADSVLLYLKAILAYKTGKYPEAAGYLDGILEQGIQEPYVYLFLADLYEKNLGEPGKAISLLETYLSKRSDSDVEKRLASLKEKQAQQPATP